MTMKTGDVATVTSLVGRLPVFDYLQVDAKCYMRFKTDIMFAKCAQGMVYIIPTDDARIKFVITPFTAGQDLVTQVQSCISTMKESEGTELLVPCFKLN